MHTTTRSIATPYDLFKINELRQCANDPIYFIKNYATITNPIYGDIKCSINFATNDLITLINGNNLVIAKMPRQSGKTITAALYILWSALFKPDQVILIGTPDLNMAKELIYRIMALYTSLPPFLQAGITSHNKHGISFDNGSRIIGRVATDHFARGLTTSMVYLDEFAFVSDNIAPHIMASLIPATMHGGKIVIISSENYDKFTEFDKIWKKANSGTDDSFKAFSV